MTAKPASASSAVLAPALVAARRAGGATVHRSNAMAAERAAELIATVGSPT